MTRREGTRYSVRREFQDTETVFATWKRHRPWLKCTVPVRSAWQQPASSNDKPQHRARGQASKKQQGDRTSVRAESDSNLPQHSRRTDPLTSSTHAEPEDHKANSGRYKQIYPCTLERQTTQPKNLSNRHVQSVGLASLCPPSLFDCMCAAQQSACTSLDQHSAVGDAPPRTAL
jgi:hypothetical protein